MQYWQRKSAVHSFQWNTHNFSSMDELNPRYHGTRMKDPITDEVVIHYPFWKRRVWYLFSLLAMLPLLLGGVAVMTFSLNLNGYVQDKNSVIYVGWLAQYAEPVSEGREGGGRGTIYVE